MGYQTLEQLKALLDKHGPQEFGRICQAILERILEEDLGYQIRIRKVERPDIQAVRDDTKLNIEVKAQDKPEFSITQRDLDGVFTAVDRESIPIIAVLDVSLNPEWMFLDAENLHPGTYKKVAAGIHMIHDLTDEVNDAFPEALDECIEFAMSGGSGAVRRAI